VGGCEHPPSKCPGSYKISKIERKAFTHHKGERNGKEIKSNCKTAD
jgi:hypothetical protein